jgi:isoquinoline 1-oxidoreductase alpha subunit
MITLEINGERREVDVPQDMPLLWVLRDVLGLTGTKFGCGIAQCGACTVHLAGKPVRSCLLSVGSIGERAITTIEAVGTTPNGAKVQKAWLDLEVIQCGYCQSGQIMSATALLDTIPSPRTQTSTRPWPATSVAAAPTCASGRRSNAQQRRPDRHAQPSRQHESRRSLPGLRRIPKLSRRGFLETSAATALCLGSPSRCAPAARPPLRQAFAPNGFIRIDGRGTSR